MMTDELTAAPSSARATRARWRRRRRMRRRRRRRRGGEHARALLCGVFGRACRLGGGSKSSSIGGRWWRTLVECTLIALVDVECRSWCAPAAARCVGVPQALGASALSLGLPVRLAAVACHQPLASEGVAVPRRHEIAHVREAGEAERIGGHGGRKRGL